MFNKKLFFPVISIFFVLAFILAMVGSAHASPNILAARPVTVPNKASSLLQYTSREHVIGFAPGKVYLAGLDHVLTVEFVGGQSVTPVGVAASDFSSENEKVPALGKVTYKNVWLGIDAIYTSAQGGLAESTFVLQPGANPSDIRLKYNTPVQLMENGTLRFNFETGYITESTPIAFQEVDGNRLSVAVEFNIKDGLVGFTTGVYNPSYPLTIDPTYSWHTFYGSGDDYGYSITRDASGNIYVAGYSGYTWNGPGSTAPLNAHSGNYDIVVVKLNSVGSYQWHTFWGSSSDDGVLGITSDGSGIYLTGKSLASWNGPGSRAPLNAYSGEGDITVVKLNYAGTYQWHTFYGSANDDYGTSISNDGSGIYITGMSTSTWNGPGSQSALNPFEDIYDIVVVKLNVSGAYQWHAFYGGGYGVGYAIHCDGFGNVFIVGASSDISSIWPGGALPLNTYNGGGDILVIKLNSAGVYQWHTFYGAVTDGDSGHGITSDTNGNIYVVGHSWQAWDGPGATAPLNAHTINPINYLANSDIVIFKLNNNGNYQWHTFYGASSPGADHGIAIDSDEGGNLYVLGSSYDTWNGAGSVSPLNTKVLNYYNLAVIKLSNTGYYQWHTFYGVDLGTSNNRLLSSWMGEAYLGGIISDGNGNVYITSGKSFPWNGPNSTAPLNSSGGINVIKMVDLDQVPAGYAKCADEGGRCNFSGTANVVYGVLNYFTSPRSFTYGVDCNNSVFGDPFSGTNKACYYKITDPLSTCPSLSDIGIKLFDSTDCTGWEKYISQVGFTNLPDFNDQASSIYINSGWSVKVYQSTDKIGSSRCINTDMWNLSLDYYTSGDTGRVINNDISSIEVFNNSSCAGGFAPSVPLNFRNSSSTQTSITMTWNDVSNESGYKIYKWNGLTGIFDYHASVGANTTSYTETRGYTGWDEFYEVSAYNENGESAHTNWVHGYTLAPPDPPSPTSPINGSLNSYNYDLAFQWNPSPGASEYLIEWWGGPYTNMFPCGWSSVTSCHIGTVSPGHTYYWHVKARNNDGESSWSTTWSFTINDGYEIDNTCEQAKTISHGETQNHLISPVGDVDWKKFTLTQTSNVTISTSGTAGDTELWLYSSNCTTQLGYDDDSGVDLFSSINMSSLAVGTYYVLVKDFGNDGTIDSYGLNVSLFNNTTPTLLLGSPSLPDVTVTQGDIVPIQWTDADPDNNAFISLARDTDNNPQNNLGQTTIVSGVMEDPDTPNISISNGKANWQVSRNWADQYIYRNIPEFSGPVKLTVSGQVNSATNNCIVKAGIGNALNTGPAVEFGYFGGGCPVNDYLITGSIPLNLSAHTCDLGSAPDWLWVNSGTLYNAILTIGNSVLLDVPGIGSVTGSSYSSTYNKLYVGLTGDGDWPSCSGSIESITVEPLNNQAAAFTEEFNSASNFTTVAEQFSWNTANVPPGTYYIWGSIDDGVNSKVYSMAPGKVTILPPVTSTPLSVVINEVAWAGTLANDADEWVELYNPGTSAINITGWKLKNSAATITLSGSIPAAGYFLIEDRQGAISDVTANQVSDLPNLVNGNDPLQLLNSIDTVIDTANGDGGAWPAGNAANANFISLFEYSTMERIDPSMIDSDSNWATNDRQHLIGKDASNHPINGTPGQRNSSTYEDTDIYCANSPSIIFDQNLEKNYDELLRKRDDIDIYQFKVTQPYTTIVAALTPPVGADLDLSLFYGCNGSIDQVWDIGRRATHIGRRATHIGGPVDPKIYVRFNVGKNVQDTYYLSVRTRENGNYAPSPYLLNVKLIPPKFNTIDTLILYNPTRFKGEHGLDNASIIMEKLTLLAGRTDVNGLIVQLDQFPDVMAAYTNWDNAKVINGDQQSYDKNVKAANLVSDRIRVAMSDYMLTTHQYITDTGYVVIVGDDHQIPFRRVDIKPPHTGDIDWKTEQEYFSALGIPAEKPTDAALMANQTLSDNFYGDYRDIGQNYFPSFAVGRLLDTPERIQIAIDSFIENEGVIDLSNPKGRAAVAGDDFLIDSAQLACNSLQANNGLTTDCTLMNPPNSFTGTQLLQKFVTDAPNIVAYYGHTSHTQLFTPTNPSLTSQQILLEPFSPLTSPLWWAVGCQSGLVLPQRGNPPSLPPSLSLSLTQALADHGVTYLGNTGWAWGTDGLLTYSERLYNLVGQQLRSNQTGDVAIGDALRIAKEKYSTQVSNNSNGEAKNFKISYYDYKVLSESTLYGLPMLKFKFPPTVLAAQSAIAPQKDIIKQELTSLALPPNFKPTVFGPGNLTQVQAPDYNGNTYFTGGLGEFTFSSEAPVLPQSEYLEFRSSLGKANGVLWKGGNYAIRRGNNPLVLNPTQLNGTPSTEPSFNGTFPLLPVALIDLQELDGAFMNHLTFQTGQFIGSQSSGTLRLFSNMDFVLGLWNGSNTDVISPELGGLTMTSDGSTLHIEIPVTDTSGVFETIVTYTEVHPLALSGAWQSVKLTGAECTPGQQTYSGDVPLTSNEMDFFIQVMDCHGNVTVKMNDGQYYQIFSGNPFVNSITRANPNPTSANSVNFTVKFSEIVTGVNTLAPFNDFALTTTGAVSGATVSGVSGSGSVYTVTVNSGSGAGTIRLNVADDNSIVDAASDPLGGAGVGDGNFTSGETYSISSFGDVSPTYWAWKWIESFYQQGITTGCAQTPVKSYCPENNVTRAEMAVFVERALHGGSYQPPVVPLTFNDINGHWAQYWIERFKSEGITTGCGGGKYCPDQNVTRAEMSVFILRALHGGSYQPPVVGLTFNDTSGHWAQYWIEQFKTEGITTGCGGGKYCPDQNVTRAEMAVFIVRAFGYPVLP